jgi:hypothetical protein
LSFDAAWIFFVQNPTTLQSASVRSAVFRSALLTLFCSVGCDPSEYPCCHGAADCGFVLFGKCNADVIDGYEFSRGNLSHHFVHFDWSRDNNGACTPLFAQFGGDFLNFGKPFAVVQLFNLCCFLFWYKLAYVAIVKSF